MAAGYTRSFGTGSRDMWLIKLDSNGNPVWQKTYGGPESDEARSIKQTADGGYLVAGKYYGNYFDFWLLTPID